MTKTPGIRPTVVFDLDGTLVDSVLDLVPALNRTIASQGLAPVTVEQIRPVVSFGSRAMIQKAFEIRETPLSAELLETLFAAFLATYEDRISDHTPFFEGCTDALDALDQAGFLLAVCTNKHQALGERLLIDLGAANRFSAITGGDSFAWRKPDPKHVLETVKLAGGDPQSAIMVGDSFNDIEAARQAKVTSIAVDFGYTDIPARQLGADAVISHFSELNATINRLL